MNELPASPELKAGKIILPQASEAKQIEHTRAVIEKDKKTLEAHFKNSKSEKYAPDQTTT